MKTSILTASLVALVGSASALTNYGTAFSCNANANNGGTPQSFQYCTAGNYTSGTTASQLGKFTINPSKQITVIGGVSGSAVAGLVTPTLSLYLGNKVVATQTISVSTAGNVVTLGSNGVPYFDGLSISTTLPATISSSNALSIGVVESQRIYQVQ